MGAERKRQASQVGELDELVAGCEARNTEQLQPRLARVQRVQAGLIRKVELYLQMRACSAVRTRSRAAPCNCAVLTPLMRDLAAET